MSRTLGFFWTPPTDDDAPLPSIVTTIANIGANTVIIPHHRLTPALLDLLRAHNLRVIIEQGLFLGEEMRQQYPDSVPIGADAKPFDRSDWYIPACPSHPQLRQHRLNEIAAALDHYGSQIDGLWLDFIRFPVRWEGSTPDLGPWCFCPNCLNSFLNQNQAIYTPAATTAHARTILHEHHAAWVAWKCQTITNFVQSVKALITARHLTLPLGIFALPWARTDHDHAIRRVAGQDLAQLAPHLDTISPMVYHQICHQPPTWITNVTHDHADWSNKPILPIIQSVHHPATMTPDQLDQALTAAHTATTAGVLIFTLDPILATPELATVVRHHFTHHA